MRVYITYSILGVLFLSVINRIDVTSLDLLGTDKVTVSSSRSILSMPFDELSESIGGSGRARLMWDSLSKGINPLSLPIGEGISQRVRENVAVILGKNSLISTEITEETASDCGTRKFLQKLSDGQSVESVLIPALKFGRTTLCVSTQIGCDRGCAFCMTGKMGLIRNLTSSEIVSQVFQGLSIVNRENMPPMTNVVFMGMGDSGRNMEAVGEAVLALTCRKKFSMASSKITISTVGPSPEAFLTLANMPGTLAWSLHSPDDVIRKKLVPSTKHSTVELRDGLVKALQTRAAIRTRTIMIALTLIDGINDSAEDALKLAVFLQPMDKEVPRIAIDLIPYNDINIPEFKKPSREKVNAFQQVVRKAGYFCTVRVTRGEEESSACGMLATKRIKKLKEEVEIDNLKQEIMSIDEFEEICQE